MSDNELPAEGGPVKASVYQQLRADVLDGAFAPGSVLYEPSLSKHYDVSRTPIREALARLQHDDLIERSVRGYRIRSGTPTDVLNLYETRIPLEELAAQLAARRRSDLGAAGLRMVHEKLTTTTTTTDHREMRTLHTMFHERIWREAQNASLFSTLRRLTSQLRIYDRVAPVADDHALIFDEHANLLSAIENGDASRAGAIARDHLERTRTNRLTSFASQADSLADARSPWPDE